MADMTVKRCLQPASQETFASAALLLVRVVAGIAFMTHGWGKIQTPLNWMGPDSPVPGFFQLLAALSEFGGGFGWILGLLTPLASFGIGCTMTVAVYFHLIVRGDPFVNLTGGLSYEPASIYLCICLLLLALGPGKFSLDRNVFGKRS